MDGSVRYFAAVESAADDAQGDSPVARRLLRELAAAGHAPGDVGVCIGDGAAWLRRLFGEWFPDAVQVVDFFHAAEYLWAAALRPRDRLGEAMGEAAVPAAQGGPRRPGAGGAAQGRRRRMRHRGPLHRRAARRMRYDAYLAHGLPIGSGRAEAACKTVVGRRLKCTGMRWSMAGANPVLWVRCARLSGWFDDYWDERLRQAA